jgi:hypothetical protein
MPIPSSRSPRTRDEFKDYILRRLGAPVIDINVDDEQVEDRIEDALIYYRDYHFDGSERVYLAYKMSQQDITNQYVQLAEDYISVIRVFDIGRATSISNLFNIRYQIHLNDLFDFSSTTYTPYVMAMRHIEELEQIFVGSKPIRFNRLNGKLHIDLKWAADVKPNDYIIVEAYKTMDPDTNTLIWSDQWLRRYATALVKRQWGENLTKFQNMQLPGGVQFNGDKIYDEARDEITKLEDEMISSYSLPVHDMQN